ncbi:hypothetical protein BEP19_09735 [Ammoniphilus oxalaticus]|uniref:Uncharacterized protein n=1 Tax=Ammoniphilus oxalaticus TaxID=66863 RepID=A0A419SKX8_9BACL|nr:hypothetical protein [Ammoniphilus oxalaticus]RKD24645.1 hypothetical protein BEP19_09735 [Ammoniphilus oxalaticus]
MNEAKLIELMRTVMKEELKPIEKRLGAIELRQDGMREEQSALIQNQASSNAMLKALVDDVNYIKGDVTALKEGQDRQNKVLESLALRSLEQETDIRDLKRIK